MLKILGKSEKLLRFVADRPGHDRRYAIDAGKIERELSFRPRRTFEEGLRETIQWFRDHAEWTARVRSGAYRDYYEQQYGKRLPPGRGGAPR
jgi:dTDP-glucose 4,6-dehydratase